MIWKKNLFQKIYGGMDNNMKKLNVFLNEKNEYIMLKQNTIKDENIKQTKNGYYRYVNHSNKLTTTGFGSKEALKRNSDIIRFDSETIKKMKERYNN